jgi:hypothetical protein
MFHGATNGLGNVPSIELTMRYVAYFEERLIGVDFVSTLVKDRRLMSPGEYWISGSELATVSDIVTKLDPNWKPKAPDPGPMMGFLKGI